MSEPTMTPEQERMAGMLFRPREEKSDHVRNRTSSEQASKLFRPARRGKGNVFAKQRSDAQLAKAVRNYEGLGHSIEDEIAAFLAKR
ncbi:MAG: hypothetical protein ACE361_19435 [Aureliella sp.]